VVYLDNNATTQPSPEVLKAASQGYAEFWHNPSSVHRGGQNARARVELARGQVAALLGVRAREVTFTGSGTESIDLALRGTLLAWSVRKEKPAGEPTPLFITTKVEHAAVRELAAEVESLGLARVHYCPVDGHGLVDVGELKSLLAQERHGGRSLASVQWANNETGAIQPVREIHAVCIEQNTLFHCDGVQWIGKEPISGDISPQGETPSHRHRGSTLPCDM
jgi:cysteine desulfurase